MEQNIYDFFYSQMRKTYKCNVCGSCFGRKDVLTKHKKTHEKENRKQKEGKSSHQPPPIKKQRMVIECVLIPKHKYEQLEKDATKERKFTWSITITTATWW